MMWKKQIIQQLLGDFDQNTSKILDSKLHFHYTIFNLKNYYIFEKLYVK